MAHTDEHRDKNEASASCSDLQLGWALHKPRRQARGSSSERELATEQIPEKCLQT